MERLIKNVGLEKLVKNTMEAGKKRGGYSETGPVGQSLGGWSETVRPRRCLEAGQILWRLTRHRGGW